MLTFHKSQFYLNECQLVKATSLIKIHLAVAGRCSLNSVSKMMRHYAMKKIVFCSCKSLDCDLPREGDSKTAEGIQEEDSKLFEIEEEAHKHRWSAKGLVPFSEPWGGQYIPEEECIFSQWPRGTPTCWHWRSCFWCTLPRDGYPCLVLPKSVTSGAWTKFSSSSFFLSLYDRHRFEWRRHLRLYEGHFLAFPQSQNLWYVKWKPSAYYALTRYLDQYFQIASLIWIGAFL